MQGLIKLFVCVFLTKLRAYAVGSARDSGEVVVRLLNFEVVVFDANVVVVIFVKIVFVV